MGLPSMSIKKPVFITMIFLAVMILGTIAMMELPVELYQGRAKGIISIVVNARGGLPPLEVEKNITKPVEESVSTVSHLKNMYSSSREAESRVTLEFEVGTDMNFAALEVREKFARVKPLLPKEIEKPVIANYDDLFYFCHDLRNSLPRTGPRSGGNRTQADPWPRQRRRERRGLRRATEEDPDRDRPRQADGL
jgi:multidrug efflux pump subunit AcrB